MDGACAGREPARVTIAVAPAAGNGLPVFEGKDIELLRNADQPARRFQNGTLPSCWRAIRARLASGCASSKTASRSSRRWPSRSVSTHALRPEHRCLLAISIFVRALQQPVVNYLPAARIRHVTTGIVCACRFRRSTPPRAGHIAAMPDRSGVTYQRIRAANALVAEIYQLTRKEFAHAGTSLLKAPKDRRSRWDGAFLPRA